MKIFVISHPSFTERYNYITKHIAQVSNLDWEVVGVNGQELARQPEFASFGHNPQLSPGQIGCALSHCRAYERMAEQGLRAALIVEDDIQLPQNIDDICKNLARELNRGEIIQLHNPMMEKNNFSNMNAVSFGSAKLLYPMSPRSIRSTSAYIISIEAADAIRRLNDPAVHVADHWDAFYEKGCISSIRIMHPSPCRWLPFESTIWYGSTTLKLRTFLKKWPLFMALRRLRLQYIFSKRLRNVILQNEISPLDPRYRK